jgi:uncharacterized protein (TIGR04141 family)
MRVNIFSVPSGEVEALRSKLAVSGMEIIHSVTQDGWKGSFYYSTSPLASKVSWAKTFEPYFNEHAVPVSRNPYAAFVFSKGDRCYVLSFGKSHFYIRPYCDYDFGIELAKRIANEADTRQTSSRRFQDRNKKNIKSYVNNSRLDVQSGESVDYIQAAIVEPSRVAFGKSGKFGTSAMLTPDIIPSELGSFLSQLEVEMARPARFALPRTTIINEPDEVAKLDELLLKELTAKIGTSEFAHNSYDLFGVDFVFTNDGKFTVTCPGEPSLELDDLSMADLKRYIADNKIAREDILRIKIKHEPEGAPSYVKPLKEAIDFIADGENVLLTSGRWMRFNQDYLDFLDDYLRTITVEQLEPEFLAVAVDEPTFNLSPEVAAAGYVVADKDFSIFKTRRSTPIEAWDLQRGDCVYAVKFGTPQKLGYVCDQATAVLELLRNRAEVKQVPSFRQYCLWLGYRAQKPLADITGSGSIILKQKIETWARKSRDLGIEPVLKISRKLKPGVETA